MNCKSNVYLYIGIASVFSNSCDQRAWSYLKIRLRTIFIVLHVLRSVLGCNTIEREKLGFRNLPC